MRFFPCPECALVKTRDPALHRPELAWIGSELLTARSCVHPNREQPAQRNRGL